MVNKQMQRIIIIAIATEGVVWLVVASLCTLSIGTCTTIAISGTEKRPGKSLLDRCLSQRALDFFIDPWSTIILIR